MTNPAGLLGKQLVVVTGKGGVGKSTVAAALGLAAARRGLRTIVAEVAERDDVGRVLAGEAVTPFTERELAPGLHHISIDPQLAMEEFLDYELPGPLAGILTSSRTFAYFAAATPGMRELLSVGKVWELAQADRRTKGADPYDLVILDAPATGHGMAILSAPRTFAEVARVGPVARRGRTIHSLLSDPARTGVIGVATAEEMPVNEALQLVGALQSEMGLALDLVVCNAVLPDRFSATEAEQLRAAPSSPATEAALSAHARARAQAAQLARLRRGVGGIPVITLPVVFAAELDAEALEALSRRIESVL